MRFIKNPYYSEIVFSNEFYIDGVNVFSNNHRLEKKKIDIKLPNLLSFSVLKGSLLYEIKGQNSKFKIAISEVRDFHIISFMSWRDFNRSHDNEAVTKISNKQNIELKFEIAKEILRKMENDGNTIYSENLKRKAVIGNVSGSYKVTYYSLVIEDEYDFHFHESISKNNFFGWEDEGTVSFFDTFEHSLKEARLNLGDKMQVSDYHGFQNSNLLHE